MYSISQNLADFFVFRFFFYKIGLWHILKAGNKLNKLRPTRNKCRFGQSTKISCFIMLHTHVLPPTPTCSLYTCISLSLSLYICHFEQISPYTTTLFYYLCRTGSLRCVYVIYMRVHVCVCVCSAFI